MHFLLPLLAWLFTCVLAEGPGGANYVSHSYERIWMWEMYDTITYAIRNTLPLIWIYWDD